MPQIEIRKPRRRTHDLAHETELLNLDRSTYNRLNPVYAFNNGIPKPILELRTRLIRNLRIASFEVDDFVSAFGINPDHPSVSQQFKAQAVVWHQVR